MNLTDLTCHAGVLGAALDTWDDRPAEGGGLEHIQAANTAMDTIDALLADLHAARSVLMRELRATHDAVNARVDAMLAERRAR